MTGKIIAGAMRVHSTWGPGLLESAYEAALFHEIRKTGMRVERQKSLPVWYDGVQIDCGYRLDLIVEDRVIVELKCVEKVLPIHEAQILSYLKLAGCEVGLLLNFHVEHMRDGIKRFVGTRKS